MYFKYYYIPSLFTLGKFNSLSSPLNNLLISYLSVKSLEI